MKRFTLFLASLLCCICLNAQDYDASKVYTLQNVIQGRGYLAYHADYTPNNGLGLAGVTMSGYQSQHKQTTDDGVNINFSIYKSSKGKYYLYNLGAGKFIGINGVAATYTDTATPFTITVGKESSRPTDVCFQRADGQYLCLACGYSSTTANPVRFEGYEANADQLVVTEVSGQEVDAATQDAIQAAVEAVEATVRITVNHVYNGSTFYSENVDVIEGTDLSALTVTAQVRYGLSYQSYSPNSGTVAEGNVITATYTDNTDVTYPFIGSTLTDGQFGEGMHWYKLEIQRDPKKYSRYNPANANCANATEVNSDFSTGHLFAFVGDPANGWKIYNYIAGPNKVLWSESVTNNGIISMANAAEATGNHWVPTKNGTTGYVFFKLNSDNGYMNDVNGQLGYWTNSLAASDGGGSFQFIEVSGEALTALVEHGEYAELAYYPAQITATSTNAINGLTNLQTVTGIDLTTNEATTELQGYIDAFTNAVSTYNGSKTAENGAAIIEAAASVNAEALMNVVNDALSQKYYRIKNVKRSTCWTINPSNGNQAWTATENEADVNQIWQLEYATSGNYKMKNCNKKGYLASIRGGATTTTEFGTAAEYSITSQTSGGFTIVTEGRPVQCEEAGYLNWWYESDGNARWYINEITELPVALNTVGEASYASAYLPFPVQGSGIYTGAINAEKTAIEMTEQTGVLPAETGIVIKGAKDATSTTLTIGGTVSANVTGNCLRGTLTALTENLSNYLVLGKGNTSNGIGFFAPSSSLRTIAANKAFILASDVTGTSPAIAMNFGGETTGVGTVISEEGIESNAPVFDLSGRRVMQTVKGGLYIQTGKKFIVK